MPGQDSAWTATPFTARQSIKERSERAAGDAENKFNAKLFQIINDQIAQSHDKTSGKIKRLEL
jgi:hypothetical protein